MVKKLFFLCFLLSTKALFAQYTTKVSLTEKQSGHLVGIAQAQFGTFIYGLENLNKDSKEKFLELFENGEITGMYPIDAISKEHHDKLLEGNIQGKGIYSIGNYIKSITSFKESDRGTHFSAFQALNQHQYYALKLTPSTNEGDVSAYKKYTFTLKFGFSYSAMKYRPKKEKINEPLNMVECMFVVELPHKDDLIDFEGIYELKPEHLKIRSLRKSTTHNNFAGFKETQKLVLYLSAATIEIATKKKISLQNMCEKTPSKDTPYNRKIIEKPDTQERVLPETKRDSVKVVVKNNEEPKEEEKRIVFRDLDTAQEDKPNIGEILAQIQSIMPIYAEGFRAIGEKDSLDFQKDRIKYYLMNLHQYNRKIEVEAAIIPRVVDNKLVDYLEILQKLDYDQVLLNYDIKTDLSPTDLAVIANEKKNELSKRVALSTEKAQELASLQPANKAKYSTAGIKVGKVEEVSHNEYAIHVWYSWTFVGLKYERERRKHRKHTCLSFKEAKFIVRKQEVGQGKFIWKVYMDNTRVLYAQKDVETNPFK